MPVMRGRDGFSCAASKEPARHAARKRTIGIIRIYLNLDMRRDCLGNASLFWTGMRAGEFGAARPLLGSEFHEFDAGLVCVVEIKLPLAVAADFRNFCRFDAGFDELVVDGMDVWNA